MKVTTTVSLDSEVKEAVRKLGINVSDVCNTALKNVLRESTGEKDSVAGMEADIAAAKAATAELERELEETRKKEADHPEPKCNSPA